MVKNLISFVIPCYRSDQTISRVINEIIEVVSLRGEYDYEIIAVDDCSPDRVLKVLSKLASENPKIKVLSFAKNVGKHAAILAGYRFARGEFVVDLDDDLQSPTYELWRLLEPIQNGEFDYATAKYFTKKQSLLKRLGSDFNLVMSAYLLKKPKSLRFENFNAMKHFVSQEAKQYTNPYPYLEGLILRITSKIAVVDMDQRKRGDDRATGFTFRKSAALLFNGLTGFSVKPLRIASILGLIFAFCGAALAITIISQRLIDPSIVAGYSSLMAAILFMGGNTMLLLGIIGEYLGRIYICINTPPQYVIRDTFNIPSSDL